MQAFEFELLREYTEHYLCKQVLMSYLHLLLFISIFIFACRLCADQGSEGSRFTEGRDSTFRVSDLAMAHSESHAKPTDHGISDLESVVFLHYSNESDARNDFFQDETHG